MKLNANFITHDADGEQIMVATGSAAFAGLVRSNKTAAYIVEQLKNEISMEQLVEAVYEKYDAPRETIAKDVSRIVDSLKGIGAIDG